MAEAEPDVLVVGGGPAGLSCALLLGRCRRKVVVFDDGRPRNARARGVHGFLTREGMPPHALRWVAREQLAPYDVALHDEKVADVRRCTPCGFEVVLESGAVIRGKKLVLATGMRDDLPAIEGLEAFYGVTVHTCPYCDGWDHRDGKIAAYAPTADAADFALGLTTWSRDIVLFTDGGRGPSEADARRLDRCGITVVRERVAALEGETGRLAAVRLASGETIARDAMFVHMGRHQRAPFAARLGLAFDDNHNVVVQDLERSGIPGLWVIGDASRDVQFAIIAASEGARAAYAINMELREETCAAWERAATDTTDGRERHHDAEE